MSLIDAETYTELRALEVEAMTMTGDLWRSPAPVGNKYGAPVEVAADLACEVIPAELAAKIGIYAPGLGAGRAQLLGLLPYGTAVQNGDELRIGASRYTVEGVAEHSTVVACALSEAQR